MAHLIELTRKTVGDSAGNAVLSLVSPAVLTRSLLINRRFRPDGFRFKWLIDCLISSDNAGQPSLARDSLERIHHSQLNAAPEESGTW
jgi:hypothetical protein